MTVDISGDAHRDLSNRLRLWSGWADASLSFVAVPEGHASVNNDTHQFTADPEDLILNPNRVLRTVTPFRLRQEAVLTGALLHEAGHARYSHWDTEENLKGVSQAALDLAVLMEEARIEGRMTAEAETGAVPGAHDLAWTMRAAAAHLLPMTQVAADPDQALMDVLKSWALRAGRQYAVNAALGGTNKGHAMPHWVQDFTSLFHGVIVDHFDSDPARFTDHLLDHNMTASSAANRVIEQLIRMAQGAPSRDTNGYMVLTATRVLDLLFPETEEPPSVGGTGCGATSSTEPQPESDEDSEGGASDDDGEDGEGNTEPEDEGSGDEPGAGDSGEDEAEPEDSEEGPEADSEGDQSDEQGEGEGESTPEPSPLAAALSAMETSADAECEADAEDEKASTPKQSGSQGGSGTYVGDGGGYRDPSATEREIQDGAERFLRGLIAPSEKSHVVLTESPSSSVDGSALAAWKAGGQTRDPRFFRRIRRESAPAAPVKIAVLVDVSSSMDQLQKPSALLSWAIAAAAIDLRNFAGRGVQVESCMIHWGNEARVIQHNGELLPGIREHECREGTHAMAEAFDLVDQEMPGFFDLSERPENRLLVQFTDWELFGKQDKAGEILSRGFEAGINMLTVAPRGYSVRRSNLDDVMALAAKGGRAMLGTNTVLPYNPMFPEQVWEVAAETLA